MNNITIFTDVNSDLTDEYIKNNNIIQIPIYYRFDDKKVYGDEEHLTPNEFYKKLEEGNRAYTAGCNPEKVYELFKKELLKGKDILCILFSSEMSTGYNSAKIAMEMIKEDYPNSKIELIDSLNGSMAEGFLVKEAVNMVCEGDKDLYEIKNYLEVIKRNFKVIFTVSNLKNLVKSGRVSHLSGLVGDILNIKPIFTINDEGKIESIAKARGSKKAISFIIEYIKEFNPKEIAITHADDIDLANFLKELIEKETNIIVTYINQLNLSIGAHSGKSSFGISFYK